LRLRSRSRWDVPWGDAPHEFGLRPPGHEQLGIGPECFAVDKKENIYIFDKRKHNIKKFDKDGNYVGNIGTDLPTGSSMAVGTNGHIFVIRGHTVDEYLQNGKLLKKHGISKDINLIYGAGQWLLFDHVGKLFIKSLHLYYQIGKEQNGKFEALSHQNQKASERMGFPSRGQDKRITPRYRNKYQAMMQMLDPGGKVVKEFLMYTNYSFAGLYLLGQDRQGFIYIMVGVMTSETSAHFEVRKYDEEGNLFATLELTAKYYIETNDIAKIDEDGNVYQFLTTPEGVQVIKWEQQ
jgi:hypothetical protein